MNRTRPPTDGRCQVCRRHVGVPQLNWDHCHDCGAERGWICTDCNLTLTEHCLYWWDDLAAYNARHQCHPRLIDVPPARPITSDDGHTKRVYIGNGPNDPRYIRASTVAGKVTIEQAAAVMGVSAGTARDALTSRPGNRTKRSTTLLIDHQDLLNHLHTRWGIPT